MRSRKVGNKALATAVGVEKTTVSKWRHDVQTPEGENIEAAARHLGVTVQWLRSGVWENASSASATEPTLEQYRAPSGLPQQARVWMHSFLLELATGGASEEEIDAARRLLTSEEAYAMYAGGVEREMSGDEVLTEMQGVAEGIRVVLRRRGRKV